jgi:hypothetical protein
MVALCFAHLLTITAWLEVRVLSTPPRSLTQTEISRLVANSPELSGIRARILSLQAVDWRSQVGVNLELKTELKMRGCTVYG